MGMVQAIYCRLGRHQRDRSKVHYKDGSFLSVCKGCARPMARTPAGWIVVEETGTLPPAPRG